ncbi:MAG TPA: DUF1697 domain-containing protein [Candidatus Acidoferrales bacterium]|nr:DUF1697 domain-containing protein [Candidatus Acidoferrales bacterium]
MNERIRTGPTVTVHIALLRAVNLPAHNKVAMSELRALATDLGFTEARTLLQSGNLVFRSDVTGVKLERVLETEARKRLGLDTHFIVRTARQWNAIVAGNPLPMEARQDPAHLVVMVCKDLVPKTVKITGARREIVRPRGREIYVYYPDGIGVSRLKIDVCGTARNWNTVLKLAALTGA